MSTFEEFRRNYGALIMSAIEADRMNGVRKPLRERFPTLPLAECDDGLRCLMRKTTTTVPLEVVERYRAKGEWVGLNAL